MFTVLKKSVNRKLVFALVCFIAGSIPAVSFTHIIPVDFSGFYFQAVSFLEHHRYAYQFIQNYCDNPINTGLNARAPLVPFFMAVSMSFLGKTLLGTLLPFFIARIFLLPVVFFAARQILSDRLAFVATLLLVFIPKLQTYSFSSPEGDVFVALFYACALYFYFKSKNGRSPKLDLATGLSLGLASLTKSTGLGLSVGFILAVFLENLIKNKSAREIVNPRILRITLMFLLLIGPYLFWTWSTQHQLYIATQHDRSPAYIFSNIPFLLQTLPLYLLGIDLTLGGKFTLVSILLFSLFLLGVVKSFISRQFTLTLPALTTLFLMSTLNACVIGGNTPANYELITILGFAMIPSALLLFLGMKTLIKFFTDMHLPRVLLQITTLIFPLVVVFKFANNYFSAPYSLDFTGSEYYISMPQIVQNRELLPEVKYVKENGLLMFKGPTIHKEIRKQFQKLRTNPFSPFSKTLLLVFTLISYGLICLPQAKNENSSASLAPE